MVLETYTDVNELIGSETISKRNKKRKSIEIPWEERTSGDSQSRELVWMKVWGHLLIKGCLEMDGTTRPSLVAQTVKSLPVVWVIGFDPWENGMATHCSILAWRTPWTEEPGGPQSKGLQRVGYNWVTQHGNGYQVELFQKMYLFTVVLGLRRCAWLSLTVQTRATLGCGAWASHSGASLAVKCGL